jgi:hypothetical protein
MARLVQIQIVDMRNQPLNLCDDRTDAIEFALQHATEAWRSTPT